MAHTFRKYLSNRGSALFMVLSTMTALMICCMAMYFSVVSSRSTQYAVFNQQQSYSSAASISDALVAGLMDGSNSKLAELVAGLKNPGDTVTTGANGFAAFSADGSGDDEVDQLGAYSVTITLLDEDGTYDLSVTSSVNGVKDIFHMNFTFSQSPKVNPPAPSQVFAATGYVPNDVFLEGGTFYTDVFFDNENTLVNAYGGKNMELYGDLATGGSLELANNYLLPRGNRAYTYAIRGNFTHNGVGPITFPNKDSVVYIGGDAVFNKTLGFTNCTVYILGDLYLFNNAGIDSNTTYIVAGNVYHYAETAGGNGKYIYTNGNIYPITPDSTADNVTLQEVWINGVLTTTIPSRGDWSTDAVNDGFLSKTEMIKILDEKTASNVYYKWIIDMNDIPGGLEHKTLTFHSNGQYGAEQNWEQYVAEPTEVLTWTPESQGCIIDDLIFDPKGWGNVNPTIIIDTGLDENNVYTIQVSANYDLDGDGVKETFMWQPKMAVDANNPTKSDADRRCDPSSYPTLILVMGRGSVVVNVPKGVTYQSDTFNKFMHYGWYVLGEGTEDYKYASSTTDYEHIIFSSANATLQTADTFVKYVHTDCHEGDGCEYSTSDSTNTCSICGVTKKILTCSEHRAVGEYCPDCESGSLENTAGACKNRVDRKEIDKTLAANSNYKERMTGSDGEIIYPTVNIFLVSCEESADIRLSQKRYSIGWSGKDSNQNGFFGYVYAPYMTFKAYGANSGGFRLFGGMTVSDYVIDDSTGYVSCWPEKMPTDLMSEESKNSQLGGVVSKSWKMQLNSH